jgi:hypothetical protein
MKRRATNRRKGREGAREGCKGSKGSQSSASFTLTYLFSSFLNHAYVLAHVHTNKHRHDVSIGNRGMMMVKPLPDYTGEK